MTQPLIQPNPITALLPIILIIIPIAILVNILAREKGKNVTLWTILACIPVINFISVFYIVGTTNSKVEAKMDKILEALNESNNQNK